MKMEELDLLKKFQRMKAPSEFEQNIWKQINLRKKKNVKVRHFRIAFAGATSFLVVIIAIGIIFFPSHKNGVDLSRLKGKLPASIGHDIRGSEDRVIPIMENVDYLGEIRAHSRQSRTIYILEQVSDNSNMQISF